MSQVDIRAALETRLSGTPGALPDAQLQRENKKFEPTQGVPYWSIYLERGPTENPAAGQRFRRYRGNFIVKLAFPFDSGTGACETLADAVAARFARGLSSTANQVRTIFDRDPDVKPGRVVGDRWEVLIVIRYYADVQG